MQGNLSLLLAGVKAETVIDGKTKEIRGGDLEPFVPLNDNLDLATPEKLKVSASGSVTYKGTKKVGNIYGIADSIEKRVESIMKDAKDWFLPTPRPPIPTPKPNVDE